jgi:anti-sigma factor RsiW
MLERQAHGALDPADAAELQAHVASCASCQAFAALIRQVEGQLAARAADAENRVVWADCERRVEREARGMRVLPWTLGALCLGVPGVFLCVFVTQLVRHRSSEVSGWMAALTSLFFVWVFVAGAAIRRRWLSRYTLAQTSREGLFAMYREQLAEDRRSSRQAATILLVAATAALAVRALGPTMIGVERISLVLLAAVFFAAGSYFLFRRAPQIDRQIRELG